MSALNEREEALAKANALLKGYRKAKRTTMMCVAKNFIQLIEKGKSVEQAKSFLHLEMHTFLTRKFIDEFERED